MTVGRPLNRSASLRWHVASAGGLSGQTAIDVADYMSTLQVSRRGAAELSLPVSHFESLDGSTESWCRDWRAEIRMTDLAADSSALPVTVGAVDFVLVQLGQGRQPVADFLSELGTREARFGELFHGRELDAALDEHSEFFDGMPIFTVLLVLDAIVDDLMPASRLRPWSVAEVIRTMLPTNSGLAVAASALGNAGRSGRQLVSADRLDRDWLDVGLTAIPGHPALVGRATMFTYLDDARAALDGVANEVFAVRAGG